MGDDLPVVDLGTGRKAVTVYIGDETNCAILDNGSTKCWGRNSFGQLGLGDIFDRGDTAGEMGDNLPTINLGTGRTALSISVGGNHVCALLERGTVKCWGGNDYGQLGIGDEGHRGDGEGEMGDNLPAVDLGTGRTAVSISTGEFHSCAVLDDWQTVTCWGKNVYGTLGQGSTTNRGVNGGEMGDALEPVDLTGDISVCEVSAHQG
jgi:alpha-tubulin suppressor-like RCC1 family protein